MRGMCYASMQDAAAAVRPMNPAMDSMWHQHPAATHHAIACVWTYDAAPHAAMESPFHLAMVSQSVRPVPRGTEHSPRLTRESPDRNSRRYFSSMGHLLGDAVYRAACNGGDSLQKGPR